MIESSAIDRRGQSLARGSSCQTTSGTDPLPTRETDPVSSLNGPLSLRCLDWRRRRGEHVRSRRKNNDRLRQTYELSGAAHDLTHSEPHRVLSKQDSATIAEQPLLIGREIRTDARTAKECVRDDLGASEAREQRRNRSHRGNTVAAQSLVSGRISSI